MAPSFDHLREADLDDDEFNEDDIDISDLRERFEVSLEQGYDSFVVIDGLPKVTEAQKPKLIKFLLKKLNTVGKTREDLIHMPMGDDGNSLRYEVSPHFSSFPLTNIAPVSPLSNIPLLPRPRPPPASWTRSRSTSIISSVSTSSPISSDTAEKAG